MATDPQDPAATVPPPVATIHEAELASGPSGGVLRGAEIDLDDAVARRRAGGNVVVCGDDTDTNRGVASTIESTVGPCLRSDPHKKAGPLALPHYQPQPRPPQGHTFYETARRKARKAK
jgi:hypothetical protein